MKNEQRVPVETCRIRENRCQRLEMRFHDIPRLSSIAAGLPSEINAYVPPRSQRLSADKATHPVIVDPAERSGSASRVESSIWKAILGINCGNSFLRCVPNLGKRQNGIDVASPFWLLNSILFNSLVKFEPSGKAGSIWNHDCNPSSGQFSSVAWRPHPSIPSSRSE